QRVLDERAMGLVRLGHAQGSLRHHFDARAGENGGKLGKLARVVGGQHHARTHACTSASARACKAISSPIPAVARSSRAPSSARPKLPPSAVPCTSTKRPALVITTFMSV